MDARRIAGALSLLAAFAHGGLTSAHFAEWWGYGVFFLAATVCQAVLGLALLMDAFEEESYQRAVAWAGVVGNTLVVAMYILTRTVGVPFVGPLAGKIEPIDAIGVATLVLEVGIVLLLIACLGSRFPCRRAPASRPTRGER